MIGNKCACSTRTTGEQCSQEYSGDIKLFYEVYLEDSMLYGMVGRKQSSVIEV